MVFSCHAWYLVPRMWSCYRFFRSYPLMRNHRFGLIQKIGPTKVGPILSAVLLLSVVFSMSILYGVGDYCYYLSILIIISANLNSMPMPTRIMPFTWFSSEEK